MKNKHEFYMDIAVQIAKASYCERSKVGALLMKDDNIISFGYNGTPRGFDNTCEVPQQDGGSYTKREVLHAESNAILKCAQSTLSSRGAALYITVAPCFDCAKLIIQAGISQVIYLIPYRNNEGLNLLLQANIPTIQI